MADVIIQDGNINWKIRDLRKMNFPTEPSTIENSYWIEYDEEGNPILKVYHDGKAVVVSNNDCLMNKQDKSNLDSIFHQTSTTYEIGDQVHVAEFPSYYVLECTNAGTTGNNRPDFSSIDIEATSSEEGESNTINSISLNGTVLTPDSNKNVDIVINDATSTDHGLMSNNDKINLDYLFHKTSTDYEIGDQVHVTDFPSYYVLECVEAGTTSNTKPDFSSIDIEATRRS